MKASESLAAATELLEAQVRDHIRAGRGEDATELSDAIAGLANQPAAPTSECICHGGPREDCPVPGHGIPPAAPTRTEQAQRGGGSDAPRAADPELGLQPPVAAPAERAEATAAEKQIEDVREMLRQRFPRPITEAERRVLDALLQVPLSEIEACHRYALKRWAIELWSAVLAWRGT